jgi:hypothetical protein
MLRRPRGDRNAMWIEKYCLIPSGLDRGQRVRLTTEQKYLIRKIYDDGENVPVSAPLSAYLALLHVCGFEAVSGGAPAPCQADIFTVWGAAGPDLRAVLKREGAAVMCPELGTRHPAAA